MAGQMENSTLDFGVSASFMEVMVSFVSQIPYRNSTCAGKPMIPMR